MAASSSLKIVSPTVGQKIGSTSVDVQYQLTDSGASAAPSPTYRVQLDGRDPSETLDTDYSFTGLAPGPHSVTVELVDANHTPIQGSLTVVHFNTFTPGIGTPETGTPGTGAPAATPGAAAPSSNAPTKPPTTSAMQPPQISSQISPPQIIKAKMVLPQASPGVLAGGVISAMRTRK
jgi:hypothetical protein